MEARLHRGLLAVFRHLPRRVRRWSVRRLAPSFTVGAMCLVERDDGRVLLLRQSYRPRWGLPGGLLARGEPADACARRETSEEVGLAVVLEGEPAIEVLPRQRRVDVVFHARVEPGGDPDAARPSSPEILEVRWFDPTRLPELQETAADALRALARGSLRQPTRTLGRAADPPA